MPCDAFLAAAFLEPDKIIKEKSRYYATIELHGLQTRGQVVIDHLKAHKENVTIIQQIDGDLFKQLLLTL